MKGLKLVEEAEEVYLWEPGSERRLARRSELKARGLVGAAALLAVDIGLWISDRGARLLKPLEHITTFMLLSRRLGLVYEATLEELKEAVFDSASRAEGNGGVRLWAAGSPRGEATLAVYLLKALEPNVSQLLDTGVEAYTMGVSEPSIAGLLTPSYSRVCKLICSDGAVYSSMGAILVVKGSRLISPPSLMAHDPVRSTVAVLAEHEGLKLAERSITHGELYSADELLLASPLLGVVPVRSVDEVELGIGDATRGLQVSFLKAIRGLTPFSPSWVALVTKKQARPLG